MPRPASTFRMVGTITRPHGVRGSLKVRPETDDPHRFDALKTLYLGDSPDNFSAYTVTLVRYQPQKSGVAVILDLEGVSDRGMVKALSGTNVWADENDLPPLEEGQVFLSDLVGLTVLSPERSPLGRVEDVMDYPAHPTLSVKKTDGSMALVPFVRPIISEVNLPESYLIVDAIEGLLEGEALSERS